MIEGLKELADVMSETLGFAVSARRVWGWTKGDRDPLPVRRVAGRLLAERREVRAWAKRQVARIGDVSPLPVDGDKRMSIRISLTPKPDGLHVGLDELELATWGLTRSDADDLAHGLRALIEAAVQRNAR